MRKIKLLGNRLLVRPLKPSLKSNGGITFLERYQDDQTQFEVLAVGPGRKLKDGTLLPLEIEPGDFIFCPLWRDSLMVLEDGRLIIGAEQVQAVWKAP